MHLLPIRSLRARLALAAALAITLALALAAVGLVTLFEHHVERRIGAELLSRLNALAAALTLDAAGTPRLDPAPADPRFEQPLGGLYWQIDLEDGPDSGSGVGALRSRSLWDGVLTLPVDQPDPGAVHAHVLPGPDGRPLLVRERRLLLPLRGVPADPATGERALRLIVASDRAELTRARADFAVDMLPYLVLIAALLALATTVQLRLGLRPLRELRREVIAIRDGEQGRLTDTYPDEIMPLVSEVNALLAAREQALTRARAWTADLAHGLKTPLAALAADADRLRAEGQPALADDLEHLATAMRRRVERELIRARLRAGGAVGEGAAGRPVGGLTGGPAAARAGGGQLGADPVAALRGLLRTLQRTPDGERLDWALIAPPVPPVALPLDDLMELLGNLLENAAKWARSRVVVTLGQASGDGLPGVALAIADDGPGVPAGARAHLGGRGVRLDQQKAGSGLGLAIARDILDAYGGRLAFADTAGGGLTVRLWLPVTRRVG